MITKKRPRKNIGSSKIETTKLLFSNKFFLILFIKIEIDNVPGNVPKIVAIMNFLKSILSNIKTYVQTGKGIKTLESVNI